MKKIVIAGASVYGLKNLSDDSMFHVFCRELHSQYPDLEITLLARHPSENLNKTYGLNSIKNLDFDSKEESVGKWFRGLNAGDSTDHLQAIWKSIEESDLLVIGGGPFIDLTIGLYRGLTPYVTLLVTIAKFLHKPVMMNGIHLGRPLKTDLAKEMTRFCIGNSAVGTLREERSRKLFADIGVDTSNLITLSDAAFGLNPITDLSLGKKVIDDENISLEKPNTIGITFRYMYWLWGKKYRKIYSKMMANLCDYLIDEFDANIIFIPHCFYNLDHIYEDDRTGHNEIMNQIKNKEFAFSISKERSLNEILAIFPHLDFIIGNRRHSLVFGAVHEIPGTSIGEEWHVKPVMSELGLDDTLFVSNEEFDLELLKEKITIAWKRKEKIKEMMKKNIPALRAKAIKNATIALEIINKNGV